MRLYVWRKSKFTHKKVIKEKTKQGEDKRFIVYIVYIMLLPRFFYKTDQTKKTTHRTIFASLKKVTYIKAMFIFLQSVHTNNYNNK